MSIKAIGTLEVRLNYFEKLHGEVICVISPEEIVKRLSHFFL
jgi:hypothetical protein